MKGSQRKLLRRRIPSALYSLPRKLVCLRFWQHRCDFPLGGSDSLQFGSNSWALVLLSEISLWRLFSFPKMLIRRLPCFDGSKFQTAGICFPNLFAFSPVIMWRTLARPLWLKLSGKTSKETRQRSPKVGIVLKSFLFINGLSSGCSKAVTQLAGGVVVLSSTHPTVPVRKIRMYKVPQTKSVFILPYFLMDWKFSDLFAWRGGRTKKQLEQVLEPPGDPYHGFYSLVLLHKIDLFKRHLNMIIDVRIGVGIWVYTPNFYVIHSV